MVNEMLAVGTSDPEDVAADVIEQTNTDDKPEGMTDAEYVAQLVEDAIARAQDRGATVRQAVLPPTDRFTDPSDVHPVVDFGR